MIIKQHEKKYNSVFNKGNIHSNNAVTQTRNDDVVLAADDLTKKLKKYETAK